MCKSDWILVIHFEIIQAHDDELPVVPEVKI